MQHIRMRMEMVFAMLLIAAMASLPVVGTGNAPPWLSEPIDSAACTLAGKAISPEVAC